MRELNYNNLKLKVNSGNFVKYITIEGEMKSDLYSPQPITENTDDGINGNIIIIEKCLDSKKTKISNRCLLVHPEEISICKREDRGETLIISVESTYNVEDNNLEFSRIGNLKRIKTEKKDYLIKGDIRKSYKKTLRKIVAKDI